jgi:hypothetical protein
VAGVKRLSNASRSPGLPQPCARAQAFAPAAGGGARAALRAVTAGAAGGLARGDVAVASPVEKSASVVAGAVASPAEETPAEMSLAAVYSSPAHKLWKDKDTCRMIIAACSEPMRKFLEKLGTQPDRLESECSSTSNPQRPDDQFFTALEAQFNDPQFQATLPWSDAHLSSKKNDPAHFPLSGRRDATYLRKQWATAAAKFETAHNRYTQSGENDECFCLCGATGFYTFSGWTVAFAQDERVNEPLSGNKAWHPKAVLSVYLWSLARNNCDVFGKKSSKVLPHGVRMTGHVVGLPSTSGGGAGGGEVLELLKKNEEGGGRTRAITLVLGWRRGPGLARGGRYGRGRWGRGRWFYDNL